MDIPLEIARRIGSFDSTEIAIGCSAARTFRLNPRIGNNSYLKVVDVKDGKYLREEYHRLHWLQGKLPVPQVLDYVRAGESEFLWTSEIQGDHAADPVFANRLPDLVRLLAKGLQTIHRVDIADCPFDCKVATRIQEAERNMVHGLVDEADFDPKRQGMRAGDLFQQLVDTIPHSEDLVFTHGDYCLPNIIVVGDELGGFVDWGRAGVADRYQDVALAVRSLTSNVGREWAELFLKEYGLADPNLLKIEWYQLLDEFF